MSNINRYLLTTIGDVVPELSGPFTSEEERTQTAILHRQDDEDKEDGLFKLDIIDGKPKVNAFFGGDIDQ